MSAFHLRGKLHEAGCEPICSLKLKIPRAKEFDKDSSVTKNILKGENKNIIYNLQVWSDICIYYGIKVIT